MSKREKRTNLATQVPGTFNPAKIREVENGTGGFRKYSPREYHDLWDRSKLEIIQDISARRGVQKRKVKEIKPEPYREAHVRILMRSVGNDPVRSNWFYLKIEGCKEITTRIRVDISPLPSNKDIEKNPDDWWNKSKLKSLLEVELLSAQCFMSEIKRDELRKSIFGISEVRPVSYFITALKAWGFEGELIDELELEELGTSRLLALCEKHFTPSDEIKARYWEVKMNSGSADPVPTLVRDGDYLDREKEREDRRNRCIDWIPGRPLDWRVRTEYLSMGDSINLSARFEKRYSKFAQKIRASLKP